MPAGHLRDNKVCAAQVVCCRDLCDAFFVAFVITERIRLVKPCIWSNAETSLQLRGMGYLYYECNCHGLFRRKNKKA